MIRRENVAVDEKLFHGEAWLRHGDGTDAEIVIA